MTLVCLFALDVCLAGVAHCSSAEPAGRQQGRKGRKIQEKGIKEGQRDKRLMKVWRKIEAR